MLEYYKSLNLHFVRICPTCLKVLARRLEMEELYMDGEKAARPEFTYPYCYEDHGMWIRISPLRGCSLAHISVRFDFNSGGGVLLFFAHISARFDLISSLLFIIY